MADIFTFVKGNKKKVYNIAGGTEEEAIKYVRYLHRNALFGTHTGLPQKIRNSKMNESLVSNIGDYSVLDVYAYPQTKCIIGTVVNFHIINDVNPLGETYVYPCTDRNKPMGYMISDATSEELGVCLVHGVLEVPLYYFSGSTEEKKDFVEYDIENACFKFSDSGYPVFNVYQDVDGDWIAIILFGDVSSDYEYDGPFAVSVAGITGSTTYVNVNSGDVLFNDIRGTYDEDLTTKVALNTGESVWLKTSITGNTHAYDLIATSTIPIDGSTVFYTELAKNVDGNIVQNQYGDIRYSRTKLIAGSDRIILSPANGLGDVTIDVNEGAVGTTQDLTLTGSTVEGSTASIGITDSTSKINIVPENDLYVRTGTNELIIGSTTTAYIDVVTSVSGTNDASISFSNINGLAKTIHIKAGSNIQLSADGTTGIIVSATGGSVTPYVQDLTHSFSTGTATLGLTGSAITVSFTTAGNTYIEEGSNGEIVIGSTFTEIPQDLSTSITGTTAFINLSGSTSNVKLIKGNNITLEAGEGSNEIVIGSTFSEFEYDGPFAVKVDHVDETTPTTLYIVVNTGVITYEKKRKNINAVTTSTSLSSGQSYWLKYNTVSDAVSYYKASSPQADSNNVIQVKLAENVGGVLRQVQFGEIILSKPDLTWEYDTDNHIVSLGVTGSTKSITMYGKNGIVLSNDNTSNTIAIYLSGTIGTVTGITSSVASNSATISTVGGTGSVILSGGSNTYIESGDNGEIIIGSTVSGGTGSSFDYTGSFKVDCWDTYDEDEQTTYHHYRIYDTNNRDDDYSFAGWVHIGNQKYHVFSVSDDTFVDGDVIYLVGTFNDSNALSQLTFTKIQTFFPTINDNQFCVRICYATNGKMYQTQYGDIVQPARLVGDGETVEIHSNVISAIGGGGGGTVQGLYSAIKGGTPAICITGSTTYVPIAGGTNTYTERDSSGAIIVGSTVNVSGSVGFPDYGGNRESVSFGTEYGPYNYDVWLIGECGIYGGTDANIVLHLGGRTITLYDYHTSGQGTVTNYISVCIPVSASSQRSIRVVKGINDNSDMELYIYRCL